MIDPAAIARFVDELKRLLRQTYDSAWQDGVDGYEPDSDPAEAPPIPRETAIAGLTGAALLLALRQYPYLPPGSPDPVRRAVAMAPAYGGLNRMAAELAALAAGQSPSLLSPGADMTQALSDWAQSNAYRLMNGDSVAWAGEQAGFAEAANADGQFLYSWTTVGDTHVCSECELLGGFPPMALGDWPTSPGAGDTECSAGCRCTWDTWDAPTPDNYSPDLSPEQQDLTSTLADRQLQALSDVMPDAAYLS